MEESKSLLEREWSAIYQSKNSKLILTGNVEGYKYRPENNHIIALNRSYPPPKDGPLAKKSRDGKVVFLAFDSNLPNYNNISSKEVLFHVNLD